jgi:hypothetical protein
VVAGDNLNVLAKRTDKPTFSVELCSPASPCSAERQRVGDVVVKDGNTVVGKVPAKWPTPSAAATSLEAALLRASSRNLADRAQGIISRLE